MGPLVRLTISSEADSGRADTRVMRFNPEVAVLRRPTGWLPREGHVPCPLGTFRATAAGVPMFVGGIGENLDRGVAIPIGRTPSVLG